MSDWQKLLRAIKNNLASKRTPERSTSEISGRAVRVTKAASTQQGGANDVVAQTSTSASIGESSSTAKAVAGAKTSMPVPNSFASWICTSLTRQQYYKKSELWVSDGERVQYSQETGDVPIEIVVGLDFGTSFTKAAVRLKDSVFAVSWEGVSKNPQKYLLPSEYSILPSGECVLGQSPMVAPTDVRQRLKHQFIAPAVSLKSVSESAVFLALVLRYVRAWVYRVHGGKIGRSPIRWMLNLGAPSNGMESGRLEAAYRKLGTAAWHCSRISGGLDLSTVSSFVESLTPDFEPEGLQNLEVCPEFVGQMAGYVKSAQRRTGLHALIDVGGGTLDVVTFIVFAKEGQDVFPFLVPEVCWLGTQMLDSNRLVDSPGRKWSMDELQPVLDAADFAATSGLSVEQIQKRDQLFWDEVKRAVEGVFLMTRQRRDPNSPHWREGLPTFVTGGGAKSRGYIDGISAGGHQVARKLELIPLPLHPNLADFDGDIDDYQRVSVACGLAIDPLNLGEIRLANTVDDLTAEAYAVAPRPDHEDIYG
jgi:hypothetical protein